METDPFSLSRNLISSAAGDDQRRSVRLHILFVLCQIYEIETCKHVPVGLSFGRDIKKASIIRKYFNYYLFVIDLKR